MTIGDGGKYDREATLVMSLTGSAGVALVVVGGANGHGFSVHLKVPVNDPDGAAEAAEIMAQMFVDAAAQLRADARRVRKGEIK